MKININLSEIFDEDDLKRLKVLFGSNDTSDFENKMEKIVLAALFEYKEMLLGRGISSRADDIQQYRLVGLIKYYFGDTLPSEEEVSSMFQLTPSKSRSLIRNVRTRFHHELSDQINKTVSDVLENAKPRGKDDFRVVIQSDYVLEELKRTISRLAPKNETLTKYSGGARVYDLKGDTCEILCNHYDVDFDNLESKRND